MSLNNTEHLTQPAWHTEEGSALAHFEGENKYYTLPERPDGFAHLFPATILSGHLSEAVTIEGAERLLGKLDKRIDENDPGDPWHDYAAAGIAEYYAQNGQIEDAKRVREEISDEVLRTHIHSEIVFYEQDHPNQDFPTPLEQEEEALYREAIKTYDRHGNIAAAFVLTEAAEALPTTDMPILARVAQEEHPETKPDLGDDEEDPGVEAIEHFLDQTSPKSDEN